VFILNSWMDTNYLVATGRPVGLILNFEYLEISIFFSYTIIEEQKTNINVWTGSTLIHVK